MEHGKRALPILVETGAAYCGANFLVFAVKNMLPVLTYAAVATAYFFLPMLLISLHGRDPARYGLKGFPLGRSLAKGLGASLVILPLFCAGYVALHARFPARIPLADPGRILQTRSRLDIMALVGTSVLFNVLFVGITEETFYRAYVQTNLSTVFPSRLHMGGVPLGYAIPLTALLFGAVHVLWWRSPAGLLVFFPGIVFGVLREWSGGIAAPALFHGLCNTTIFVLTGDLFR